MVALMLVTNFCDNKYFFSILLKSFECVDNVTNILMSSTSRYPLTKYFTWEAAILLSLPDPFSDSLSLIISSRSFSLSVVLVVTIELYLVFGCGQRELRVP